jgi:2-oxo-4-hydroxy-4-carboxy--5-ureidoimidazoline (OHCU) decarboxylase
MADTSLPDLHAIVSSPPDADAPLAKALSILFEPSTILFSTLVPQLASSFRRESPITSYTELIDVSITVINTWDDTLRAQFVGGHPRIGESHNLSKLSAKEQGASPSTNIGATPPEVLRRLAHLNACYERTYPGLRYITFVNGRSRAAIAEEIEDVLGISHSLEAEEPKLDSFTAVQVGAVEWRAEVERATQDVGRIAKSRLKALGAE